MNRDLANAIAGTRLATASGIFFRHARPGTKELHGSTGGGRWGPEHGFPVIYLATPEESMVIEAYRRFVDPVAGMRPELVAPRAVLTIEVSVDNLLDLRVHDHVAAVGLDDEALRGPWAPCVRVARAAHQLGLHGIIAPAATDRGVTLALFEQHLPHHQWPRIAERGQWDRLPPDPRTPAERQTQVARRYSA